MRGQKPEEPLGKVLQPQYPSVSDTYLKTHKR